MSKDGRKSFGDFKEIIRLLKKRIPPKFSVKVRRVKLNNNAGDCEMIGKKFLIRVDSGLSHDAAVLILLHEWAHCLCWDSPKWLPGDKDHHLAWGIAYSHVYGVWLEFAN